MVQTFACSADNNDLYLNSTGNIVLDTGVSAIETACVNACRTVLGECVLETGIGLPNFQLAWNGTPDYALWQSYLEATLLNVEGVRQVNSISITASKNTLAYIAVLETIYSPITINGSI